MSDEKVIGGYTILSSVDVGSKTIVIGVNENAVKGDKYLCGFLETTDIFERIYDCVVSDDYIEIAEYFGKRVQQEAENFKEKHKGLSSAVVINKTDCFPLGYEDDINSKIIAIKPDILKPEYKRSEYQLYLVTGGFGAYGNSRGNAVFCKSIYDGKREKYSRMDIMGEIKPECMPKWAKEKQFVPPDKTNKNKER